MHQRSVLFVLVVLFTNRLVTSDPCRRNFGSCDKEKGLCWGTGPVTHFCSCKAGYKELTLGHFSFCADVNECVEDPALCPANADCRNTEGGYTCTCRCGFVKDYTGQYCLDASKISGLCNPDTNCPDTKGGRSSAPFKTPFNFDFLDFRKPRSPQCECESGFRLNTCNFCEDIDECVRNPCTGANSLCVNTEGSYYCDCEPGYVLGPCRLRCYRPNQQIPLICNNQNLGRLKSQAFSFKSYVRPINLPNWRGCATDVRPGDMTTERYDIDSDGNVDLILRWVCTGAIRGPRSVLKRASERQARWDSWTCWTACKPTCWGGLQTRMRRCLDGLPGADGCRGEGSQKRECYKGRKCDYRIRRDADTLNRVQIADLLQAMERYKQDTSAKGFFNAAAAHGWPNQCNGRPCCRHGARMKFLSWHRTKLLNYEEGLSRYLKDKTLGMPYWNWLKDNREPPNIVWQKHYNGRPNPFANMTVLIDRPGAMRTIQRDDNVFMDVLDFAHGTWKNVTRNLISPHTMHEFSESLESAHGGPHVSVCGGGNQTPRCRISLAVLAFAGFDPVFMFHHSQVDRLWAVAQRNMETRRSTTWTVQTALEVLEEEGDFGRRQMPFGNLSLNAFPIVRAVNTMRDSYYYEELTGIKYDNLKHDGFDKPIVDKRFLRKGGREVLFIAHYLQSVEMNVYVNYYLLLEGDFPCSELTEATRVASHVIQGVEGRPYRNSIPLLKPMEKVGFSGLDEDYDVKACYTFSSTCKEQCPEVRSRRINTMPDPSIVHYLPNQPIDVYKFIWSAGRRTPNWFIDLDSKSQWVYFFGDRTANIRQVSTSAEWFRCNTRNSRPFRCSLPSGACLLPSGIYYLIDSSSFHCQRGLKMAIVARIS